MIRARAVAVVLAACVAGCGDKGPVREPAELHGIDRPELKPRVVWDRSPGEGDDEHVTRLRLAVEQDLVVTADVEGNVHALDPANGRERWHAKTEARIVAGPTVSGGLVLLGTLDAEVIALKRADGTPAWRAPVSSEVLAPPVAEGNIVVVRCVDGKLFALSAETGARVWNLDRAVPPLTLRGLSTPLIFGGALFVGLDNGRAIALKLETGEVLWEQVVAAPAGRSELERIVDVDGELIVAGGGVFAVSFGGELAAISVESGQVAWRRSIKSYSGVTLIGTLVVVTDEEGVVWALDAETGAAAWKQEALKYRKLSAPAIVGGRIVVADLDGYLHWLAPEDGRIVARVRAVDEQITAPIVAREDRLYVLDRSGMIAVVEAR